MNKNDAFALEDIAIHASEANNVFIKSDKAITRLKETTVGQTPTWINNDAVSLTPDRLPSP